ncbi:uncharacterized protein F5891DRAFT_1209455 [Suillus fuscotomentosus]|uniref:Uncharacterized protein n=1 Tax=Suillus fuscotomentosus TaxID=1912939 RepID=A0AAD4DTP3_9AGAM|nr:uncharacterized protein F5891DRAFT_1209455 [Suillus fuscotomentosus]KAG1892969.1 hypothetical protein F5891DRAFT_1209455 [Suillus fuscotomentosus]
MSIEDVTSSVLSKCPSSALQMAPQKKVERQEHHVFEQLLESYPGLLEQLKNGSDEDILLVGELIGKGAAGTRGDDTKTLKSAVLDWIVPQGEAIQPPLHRNSKIDRGFNHDLTGFLLCPVGLDWNDSQTKENLRSGKLWAYKHVFTSPSSVEKEPKATQSGNARLHGMNSVTTASIAYIATQTFYHSLLDLLGDPDESKEVDELLMWWNWYFRHLLLPNDTSAPIVHYRRFVKNTLL